MQEYFSSFLKYKGLLVLGSTGEQWLLKRDRRAGQYAGSEAECGVLELGDYPSSPQQGVGDERMTQAPQRRVTFV